MISSSLIAIWKNKLNAIHAPLWLALDYKPRILGPKIEGFSCLVHKLSVVLTALQYKPQWKNGAKYIQTAAYYIMAHVRYLIRHNVIGMFLIIVTKPFKTRLSIYYVYNFRNSWLKLFFISLFSLPFRPKWFSVLFIHRNILLGISEESRMNSKAIWFLWSELNTFWSRRLLLLLSFFVKFVCSYIDSLQTVSLNDIFYMIFQ